MKSHCDFKVSFRKYKDEETIDENISECAVIGVADDTWGEAVAAILVLNPGTSLSPEELKFWCKERMSAYKIPKMIKVVDSLPRNAMGKVTKPALKNLL